MREFRLKSYRGIWCAVWREDKQTKRDSLGTRDKVIAQRAFAVYVAERSKPEPPVRVTVGEILAAYWEAKPKVVPRAALLYFAPLLPEGITEKVCRDYAAQRKAAAATIHTEVGILRSALIHAEKKLGWITKAPAVWMPSRGEPRDRWLTKEEARDLLDACEQPHLRLYVALALHTLARPGAITDLTWEQVSFDLDRINYLVPGTQRTDKGRPVVPITPELREMLTEAYAGRGPRETHVISWAGKRILRVKRSFEAACVRAGLEGVTPNTLRHTGATWMAEAGVEMRVISKYMGHSTTEVTERVYAKYSPHYLKAGANAVAQFSLARTGSREPKAQVSFAGGNRQP